MAKVRISKRTVDALAPGPKDAVYFDDEMTGFGVKVTPAGRKVYFAQYRSPTDGRLRRFTIGRHGAPWTPDQARTEARRVLTSVHVDKVDPSDADTGRGFNVEQLCELYLEEGCATKKASTVAGDRGRIDCHVKPILGSMAVAAVTRADIERLMQSIGQGATAKPKARGEKPHSTRIIRGGKSVATRTVGLLGGMFAFAVNRGLRPDNPVRGVRRYADRKIERFLSAAELARLGDALADCERCGVYHRSALGAIRLLALTGCRRNEIMELRWEWVDLERGCLRLPDSKTGKKIVPLGAPAVELLAKIPANERSGWVFPGTKDGEPYRGVQRVWEAVRRRAELTEEVRLHDLRHSFASVGASSGDSLLLIGALLGHKHAATTARYAHLSDDPVKAYPLHEAG